MCKFFSSEMFHQKFKSLAQVIKLVKELIEFHARHFSSERKSLIKSSNSYRANIYKMLEKTERYETAKLFQNHTVHCVIFFHLIYYALFLQLFESRQTRTMLGIQNNFEFHQHTIKCKLMSALYTMFS